VNRTGARRCGMQFATAGDAAAWIGRRTDGKHRVTVECKAGCGLWHARVIPETASSARTGSGSRPVPCTMCRQEPAQRRSRYCAACLVVRQLVLERDGYACVCCGISILDQHYSLGHRLRAGHGGRAVPSNLITLLGLGGEAHHGRIDLYRDPEDATKGYRLRSGQDPKLVPVMVCGEGGSGAAVFLWDDGTYRSGPEVAAA
jgi:hypothetical protein